MSPSKRKQLDGTGTGCSGAAAAAIFKSHLMPLPSLTSVSATVPYQPTSAAKPATPTPNPVNAAEALADWTNTTISSVLRVTVIPDQTKDRHGAALTLLDDLRGEIVERNSGNDGKPVRMTVDDIDPAFLEACSKLSHKKPLLDYLLPVYKTVNKMLKGRTAVPQRVTVLQEIKRLCMSNIVFALTMPEYVGCAHFSRSHRVSCRWLTVASFTDAMRTLSTIRSCHTFSVACGPTTRLAWTWIS